MFQYSSITAIWSSCKQILARQEFNSISVRAMMISCIIRILYGLFRMSCLFLWWVTEELHLRQKEAAVPGRNMLRTRRLLMTADNQREDHWGEWRVIVLTGCSWLCWREVRSWLTRSRGGYPWQCTIHSVHTLCRSNDLRHWEICSQLTKTQLCFRMLSRSSQVRERFGKLLYW